MPSVFKFRRGTTAAANDLTGQEGEIFVDLQAKALRLHDGVFKGGYEISSANSGATTERTLLVAQAARDTANSAFAAADAAQTRTADLSARATSQAAFDKANSSTTLAQTAFNQGNTATTLAQAAFNTANTDATRINVTPGTYGNATHVPVITVASNGRISSVSSSPITVAINISGGAGGAASQEDIQDYVAPLLTHNFHDGGRITFTYDDEYNLIRANVISSLSSISGGGIDFTQAAFNTANNASGNTVALQTVNNTQNTNITNTNTLAQAAFNQANTDVTNINTTAGTYGNTSFVPVITVAANGRILGVTTAVVSGGGATDFTQSAFNTANTALLLAAQGGGQLTQEEVQDYIAPLLAHANHTNGKITFTYADDTNQIIANVISAPQLTTSRTINDISFDGTQNITILKVEASNTANQLATARTINGVSFDGTQNITILRVEASNTANQAILANTANQANQLSTPRTINGVSFNGTQNITINAVDSTSRIASSLINAFSGVAGLDSVGQISTGAVPTLPISKINDFLIASPTSGQVLTYTGSKFENKTRVTTSSSAPSTASSLVGDLWINSDTGRQYILISDSASVKNWIQLG